LDRTLLELRTGAKVLGAKSLHSRGEKKRVGFEDFRENSANAPIMLRGVPFPGKGKNK